MSVEKISLKPIGRLQVILANHFTVYIHLVPIWHDQLITLVYHLPVWQNVVLGSKIMRKYRRCKTNLSFIAHDPMWSLPKWPLTDHGFTKVLGSSTGMLSSADFGFPIAYRNKRQSKTQPRVKESRFLRGSQELIKSLSPAHRTAARDHKLQEG